MTDALSSASKAKKKIEKRNSSGAWWTWRADEPLWRHEHAGGGAKGVGGIRADALAWRDIKSVRGEDTERHLKRQALEGRRLGSGRAS